jgi:hypothetical protein
VVGEGKLPALAFECPDGLAPKHVEYQRSAFHGGSVRRTSSGSMSTRRLTEGGIAAVMTLTPSIAARQARDRFVSLNLHDVRLLAIHVASNDGADTDDVHLDLELVPEGDSANWPRGRLSFFGCAYIQMAIDPWGKRACSSAIADATCEPLTTADAALLDQNPLREQQQPLESLLVFQLTLCTPGGELRVLARDFTMREVPQADPERVGGRGR